MVAAAQLHVIISGGFSGAYEQLLPEFERSTGIKVVTGSGASQGTGPQTIAAQLARGVPADVVILSREGLGELIAANRIAAGTDVDLAQVPLAVGVRAGFAKPDVATVDAFKRAMTNAKAVAVAGSTSGIFVKETVLPRLGIADKVNLKVTPRATGATAMVAAGEADMVVMPVSEIMHAAGVDLGGTLPSEIQLLQVFAAATVAGSKQPDAARQLIDYLASERSKAIIRKSGMEPLGRK
jgi:molybdate transport system substrate-binding protein